MSEVKEQNLEKEIKVEEFSNDFEKIFYDISNQRRKYQEKINEII